MNPLIIVVIIVSLIAGALAMDDVTEGGNATITPELSKTVWMNNCQTKVTGEKYETTIGLVSWVNDSDGNCKNTAESASLMNSPITCSVIRSNPTDPDVNCIDYNMTSVTLQAKGLATSYNTYLVDDKGVKEYIKTINTGVTNTFKLPLEDGRVLHLGDNSTEIRLNTTNPLDTYVDSGAATTNYGTSANLFTAGSTDGSGYNITTMFFINTTAFDGMIVTNASINLYVILNTLDAGDSNMIQFNRLYNSYHWTETGVTWNTRPVITTDFDGSNPFNNFNATNGNPAASAYKNFDITGAFTDAWVGNVSFQMRVSDATGTIASNDYVQFYSRERATASQRPWINLTYESGAPTQDCSIPTNSNWAVPLNLNCDLSINTSIKGYNISFENGTEGNYFNLTNNTKLNADNFFFDKAGSGTLIKLSLNTYLNTT